jgi:hypothetical protein
MKYFLSILMCLLQKSANCLINGYLTNEECTVDDFPTFIDSNDNDTIISLGQLELMALKLNVAS